MIQIIIVEDEILSRIGIQSFIEGKEDMSIVGAFETAEDACVFLRNHPVDIVITDIEMSQMNGLELIRIIRSEKLADGVIILSCHDDFAYAQEAISMGTDSYMLKYSITEESIVGEIRKVYEKTRQAGLKVIHEEKTFWKTDQDSTMEGKFLVGVIHLSAPEGQSLESGINFDGTMLTHLLEGIVERYEMGTLLTPYNKEMMIIFRFPEEISDDELYKAMEINASLITKNMKQYVSGRILLGFSTIFTDIRQMRQKYEEAVNAAELFFYETESVCLYYQGRSGQVEPVHFVTEKFLDQDGLAVFENELNMFLNKAHFQRADINKVKQQLIQGVMMMVYQIMKEYHLSQAFMYKWNSEAMFISSITLPETERLLREKLLEVISLFQKELRAELEKDDLVKVLTYIEQHLEEKITLSELTNLCCMSIPSFSKKFKEKTGVTAVEYINERRIEKAKNLMKNQKYSLWEISEMTGFSNANYLVRVFKKVTGQTASEYRKQFGIYEPEIK